MTSRGWWFLVLVLCVLTLGVCAGLRALTLMGMTLFFWFLWTWFWFSFRVHLVLPALVVRREVFDERGRVDNLWAEHSFRTLVEVENKGPLSLPYVRLSEFLPFNAHDVRGQTERDAVLLRGQPEALRYSLRCEGPGQLRFEGVRIQLADPQGFFYHSTFLRSAQVFRVLPPLADAQGRRPSVKRHNLLPSPGLHRHLRPGSGSELLDLRDYLPGDPPKTIAWKVSARRDRLITKEFETEVPIRCTLFIDTSQSVRVGPRGANALTRIVDISAAVAQASAGARDLSGLCLFDEKKVVNTIRPARGSRHLVQLLNRLAEVANLAPATGQARLGVLLPVAHALAAEVYPQLLQPEINQVPPLLPFLWPLPAGPGPRTMVRRALWFLFLCAGFLPFLGLVSLFFFFSDLAYPLAEVFLPLPTAVLQTVAVLMLASAIVFYYGFLDYCFRLGTLTLGAGRRRLSRFRKRLAALLAALHELGPGGIGRLLEDDEFLALHLQEFLAEHQVPYPLTLYDESGRYLFASPGKVDVVAQALLRAVGKGHDNELFVLLVDLLELTSSLDPLLRAVKVTLARHHQLLVICPWPTGIPAPGHTGTPPPQQPGGVHDALKQATVHRFHAGYQRLRRTFARLGVPVVCAAEGDSARLILDQLDRLRYMGLGKRR
jgi:uncharacterized protein (DUF58 family)